MSEDLEWFLCCQQSRKYSIKAKSMECKSVYIVGTSGAKPFSTVNFSNSLALYSCFRCVLTAISDIFFHTFNFTRLFLKLQFSQWNEICFDFDFERWLVVSFFIDQSADKLNKNKVRKLTEFLSKSGIGRKIPSNWSDFKCKQTKPLWFHEIFGNQDFSGKTQRRIQNKHQLTYVTFWETCVTFSTW